MKFVLKGSEMCNMVQVIGYLRHDYMKGHMTHETVCKRFATAFPDLPTAAIERLVEGQYHTEGRDVYVHSPVMLKLPVVLNVTELDGHSETDILAPMAHVLADFVKEYMKKEFPKVVFEVEVNA